MGQGDFVYVLALSNDRKRIMSSSKTTSFGQVAADVSLPCAVNCFLVPG
jgi:hypothetical protein